MTTKQRRRLFVAGGLLVAIAIAYIGVNALPVPNLLIHMNAVGLHGSEGFMTTDEVIAQAKEYGTGVELVVAGDVRQGDLDQVIAAFGRAGVRLFVKANWLAVA